jgi:hypothetical protein
MHDPLNSRNAGDAINNPVAAVAATTPFTLRIMRKTEASSNAANPTVIMRGARTDGETCRSKAVTRNVWSGG